MEGSYCGSGSGASEPSVLGEKIDGRRGQLGVVTGPEEALLLCVVVEDSRAGEVIFGLKGVEDQDPLPVAKATVVVEAELNVLKRHGQQRLSS